MTVTRQQAEVLARDAVAALQRGQPSAAQELLTPLRAGGADFLPPWLLIAQAAQAAGDDSGAADALVKLFEREPRNLAGLLLMGAAKARQGDDRAAQSFYRTALGVARAPDAKVPQALIAQLRQAEAFLGEVTGRFTAHLEAALAQGGDGAFAGGRLRYAVDLLLGRKELYPQQPSMFYFPGLAQRAFFEREEFAWLPELEAATAAMREELRAVIADEGDFAPYVQTGEGRAPPANPLLDDPSWGALYLWRDGEPVQENAARCPATMAALAKAPVPVIKARSPFALFSLLKPGTHIRPHHGLLNTRLIVHLPLVVPDGCGFRVGAETRSWREGEALIFDDSIEHEAWNRGDRNRVVLLFEIWRPEISEDERRALTAIFEAIDTYRGAAQDSG